MDFVVAQVSKPAVSPISKSAGRETLETALNIYAAQVQKLAIRQIWKSALRRLKAQTFDFEI
jgi:hypothetical protein